MREARLPLGASIGSAGAWAPGTCGELAQGMLDGRHFHVTCPIDRFAKATVELHHAKGSQSQGIQVEGPPDCPKAVQALRLALTHLGVRDVAAVLRIESPLPRGKGLPSSTADVAAAIWATGRALGETLSPGDVAAIALRVEPSDGLMFPGITLFDHRSGALCERLGLPPALAVLVLDFGGSVDTLAFNGADLTRPLADRERCWRESLDLIREGIRRQDPCMIGEGATLDSVTYAEVVPRPGLPAALALMKETGALGVNTAHSGTVLGLFFPPDDERLLWAESKAHERLPALEATHRCLIIGGGVRRGPIS